MSDQNNSYRPMYLDISGQDPKQPKPEYDFDLTTENLIKDGYSLDQIIRTMSYAGFEPEMTYNKVVSVYDEQVKAEREKARKAREEEVRLTAEVQEAYDRPEEFLKKKEESQLDPSLEGSGLGQDGYQIDPNIPSFMLSPEAQEKREKEKAEAENQVAVAEPNFARDVYESIDLRDNNISDLVDVATIQRSLDTAYKTAERISKGDKSVTPRELAELSESVIVLQDEGMLTKVNAEDLMTGEEAMSSVSEILNSAPDLIAQNAENYKEVLNNANILNERLGVEKRYIPESLESLKDYYADVFDFVVAEDEKRHAEAEAEYMKYVQEEMNRMALARIGGTPENLRYFTDKVFRRAQDIAGNAMNALYETLSPGIPGTSYLARFKPVAKAYMEERFKEVDFRNRAARQTRYASYGVKEDIMNMGSTERAEAYLRGDFKGREDEYWAAEWVNSVDDVYDGVISVAEFYVGKGTLTGIDVGLSEFRYNTVNNPHKTWFDNALTSSLKGLVTAKIDRLMYRAGVGAEAALSRGVGAFGKKKAVKFAAQREIAAMRQMRFKNNFFVNSGVNTIGEGFEEGAEAVANWTIDAIADVLTGRPVKDMNFYELSDSFIAGLRGGFGPSTLGALSSNIGHSKVMNARSKAIEAYGEMVRLYEAETDPKRKAKLKKELTKYLAEVKIIEQEEADLYETLNNEEAGEILSLNQELAKIKQTIKEGKHSDGSVLTKDEKKQLENRFKQLYVSKQEIEAEAVKRNEDSKPAEAESAADAGGGIDIVKPKKVSKEDSNTNKEMPNAAEPAPEGQGDQKKELDDYDETKDQSELAEEQPAKKDDKQEEAEGPTGTFEINVEDSDAILEDTENVGDKKGQMKFPIAAAISKFIKNVKKSGRVKKVLYFRNYEEMAKYNPEVAKMMKEAEKDGNVVAGYYDPTTGTVLTNEYTETSDVAEEILSHGMLADIIGKDSAVRAKLFKQIENLSKTNKSLESLIKEVKANYKGDESSAEVQEEVIAKFLVRFAENPASVGLKQNAIQRLVQFFNNILRGVGINATIKGIDDLQQIALKYKYAYEGGKVDVDASTTTTGEVATEETATDVATEETAERKKLDDTTEKTKEKVIEEAEAKPAEAVESIDPNNIKKPTDFETEEEYQKYIDGLGTQLSGQSLDVAEDDALNYREDSREGRFSVRKKKEFTYLKDTEIYYSTREAVVSRYGETGKYRNFQDKKVKVNDYFHYRNLYAKLTGNGKDTDAMYDMYFIKDGKKYSVKPPKPKTDKKGKVLDMPTRPSLTERIIRSRMEKAGLRQELSLQRSKLMVEVSDMLHSSNLNGYARVSDFIPPLLEGQRETMEAEIEGYVIAKKNIEAVMGMSVEQLEEMATEYSYLDKKVSKETYPDFYNQSGLKRLPPDTIDGAKPNVGRFAVRRKKGITPTASLSPAVIAKLEAIPGVKVIDISTIGFEGKHAVVLGYDSTNTDQSGVMNGANSSTMLSHRRASSATTTIRSVRAIIQNEIKTSSLKEGDHGSVLIALTTQGAEYIGGNPFVFKSESDNLINAIRGIEDVRVQKRIIEAINDALVVKKGVLKNEDDIKEQRKKYKELNKEIPEGEKIKSKDSKLSLKQRVSRVVENSDAAQGTDLLEVTITRNQLDYGLNGRNSGVRIESIEDLVVLANALSSTTVEGETDELRDTSFNFRTDVLKLLLNDEVMKILAENSKNGKQEYGASLKERLTEKYGDHELINAKSGSIVAIKEFPFIVGKDGRPTKDSLPRIEKSDVANDAFPYKVTSPLVEQYMNKENKEDSVEENAGVLYMLKDQVDLNDVFVAEIKESGGTARALTMQRFIKEFIITPISENEDIGKKDSEGRFSIRRKPESKTAMSDTGEIVVQDMSRFQEVRNFFLRKLVRKYEDIYKLQEAVEKGIDGSLPESQDFKNAETLMYGKAANDLEILQEKVDEITKLIKDKGLTIEEVENYMYGLHARERNQLILERDGVENGSGITNEEADAIIKEADQKGNRKDLDEAVDLIREIQKNTRETMVEFGLESQEKINELEEKFQFYVPLGGLATDELDSASSSYPTGGAGLHVQGGTFKQAKGRKTKAPNVLAQIVSQNASIHIKSRTNEALQSLAELVEKQPVVDKNGNAIWKVIVKPRPNDPHVVGVRIDGKQRYIRFKDASYAEALKGLGVQKANALVKMLRVPNNWLRASFTSLSPEFIITNFARDIQAAIINAAAESDRSDSRINGEKVHNDIRKLILPTLKALGKGAIGKEASMDKEIARYYKEFKEDGGKTGWAYSKSLATIAAELEAASGDKSKLQQVFGNLKNFKDSVEAINDSVENSIRLSAYIAARRAGVKRAKAAEFAKNITVNFNQHGEWGPSLNGVYLFFNASVQSSMTFARSMFYLKDAKTPEGYQRNFLERVNGAQKMAFGMAMLGGLITLLNQATSDDDEDGVSFYDKIPDYIKERNIIIMRPDGKNYFKIPLPYGYSLFHNTGVTATEFATGARTFTESTLFMGNSFINAFNPVSFGQAKDLTTKTVKAAFPTALKPAIDVATNTTYFGSPVTAEQNRFIQSSESNLSFRSPKAVRDFFVWMNEATGGSPVDPGSIDVNPDRAWYYLEFFLGGTGRFLERTFVDTPMNLKAKVEDNNFEYEANDVPFLRVLYGQPSKYYDSNKYNENTAKVSALATEIRNPAKRPSSVTPGRYNNIQKLDSIRKDIEKQLKQLRAAEREARKIEGFTERSVRIQEIRNRKNSLYMRFNKAYEKLRGNE